MAARLPRQPTAEGLVAGSSPNKPATLRLTAVRWLTRARLAHFSVVPISLNTVLKFVPTT